MAAQSEPPSSWRVLPTSTTRLPGSLKSMVTQPRTSGTWPIALIKSVAGMARLFRSWAYSLLRLSLPEMNGVLYASARSWQAWAASTSDPRVSGRSVLPQQKLSSRAIRRGWAPTATQLRTASSMTQAAMAKGSSRPYRGLMPHATARPRYEPRTGKMTAASPGPSSHQPTSGLMTVRPCTSWSYWRTIHSLLQTSQCPSSASRSAVRSPRWGSSRACWGGGVKLACRTTRAALGARTPSPGRPRPGR